MLINHRKYTRFALVIAALLFLTGVFFIILIAANESLPLEERADDISIEDIKNKIVYEAFRQVISSMKPEVAIVLSREEISQLVSYSLEEYMEDNPEIIIYAYKGEITGNSLVIRIDSKLFQVLPVQYVLEFMPVINNNCLGATLISANIGKLPISKDLVMKKMRINNKNILIDKETYSISFVNTLPEHIIFTGFELKDEAAYIQAYLSIKDINDLIKLVQTVLPEDIKELLTELITDKIGDFIDNILK
ncbi:MAG: hypothetical protein ACOX22_06275 [Caldicoprobacterales bacterium]